MNELLTWLNGRFAHNSVDAVRYNDDRFTERAKSWPKSVCVASLPQSNWNKPIKNYTCESYKVTALEINIVYRNVSILYIQYICTLQDRISTIGVVIHHTGWGCKSPNPRKYNVLIGNYVFILHNFFKEHVPGVKRDLPVYIIIQWGKFTK